MMRRVVLALTVVGVAARQGAQLLEPPSQVQGDFTPGIQKDDRRRMSDGLTAKEERALRKARREAIPESASGKIEMIKAQFSRLNDPNERLRVMQEKGMKRQFGQSQEEYRRMKRVYGRMVEDEIKKNKRDAERKAAKAAEEAKFQQRRAESTSNWFGRGKSVEKKQDGSPGAPLKAAGAMASVPLLGALFRGGNPKDDAAIELASEGPSDEDGHKGLVAAGAGAAVVAAAGVAKVVCAIVAGSGGDDDDDPVYYNYAPRTGPPENPNIATAKPKAEPVEPVAETTTTPEPEFETGAVGPSPADNEPAVEDTASEFEAVIDQTIDMAIADGIAAAEQEKAADLAKQQKSDDDDDPPPPAESEPEKTDDASSSSEDKENKEEETPAPAKDDDDAPKEDDDAEPSPAPTPSPASVDEDATSSPTATAAPSGAPSSGAENRTTLDPTDVAHAHAAATARRPELTPSGGISAEALERLQQAKVRDELLSRIEGRYKLLGQDPPASLRTQTTEELRTVLNELRLAQAARYAPMAQPSAKTTRSTKAAAGGKKRGRGRKKEAALLPPKPPLNFADADHLGTNFAAAAKKRAKQGTKPKGRGFFGRLGGLVGLGRKPSMALVVVGPANYTFYPYKVEKEPDVRMSPVATPRPLKPNLSAKSPEPKPEKPAAAESAVTYDSTPQLFAAVEPNATARHTPTPEMLGARVTTSEVGATTANFKQAAGQRAVADKVAARQSVSHAGAVKTNFRAKASNRTATS